MNPSTNPRPRQAIQLAAPNPRDLLASPVNCSGVGSALAVADARMRVETTPFGAATINPLDANDAT